MALMAERTFLSCSTLGRIEKGDASVAMGSYVTVLFVLGMTNSLRELADLQNDPVGRTLDEERLPKRIRTPKPFDNK